MIQSKLKLALLIFSMVPTCAWALDSRMGTVDQEMDCVVASLERREQISWSDVCYTNDGSVMPSTDRRMADVDEELDYVESQYDYGREKQYQTSLEYLEQFMNDAEGRRVDYQRPRYGRSKADDVAVPPVEYEEPGAYNYSYFDNTSHIGLEDDRKIKSKFDVTLGYRTDQLDWNISGDGQGSNPNILVEYIFEDIRSAQLRGEAEVLVQNHLVFEGWGAIGKIFDGSNSVSEYDQNNRQGLAVRTDNAADEDILWDISGAMGFRFGVPNEDAVTGMLNLDDLEFSFLVGYSHHEQQFNIKDGSQTVDNTPTPDLGAFPGLDSNYDAEWKGPFLGGEITGKMDRITAAFRVEYHLVDYYGWGRLNLRPEFQQPKSFEHTAEANGWVLGFDLAYQLTESFSVDFDANYQMWKTQEGLDRLFLANGSVAEVSQLNEVNWQSYALMFGGTYRFH